MPLSSDRKWCHARDGYNYNGNALGRSTAMIEGVMKAGGVPNVPKCAEKTGVQTAA